MYDWAHFQGDDGAAGVVGRLLSGDVAEAFELVDEDGGGGAGTVGEGGELVYGGGGMSEETGEDVAVGGDEPREPGGGQLVGQPLVCQGVDAPNQEDVLAVHVHDI